MKISTYIKGLDDVLHGGFLKPSAVLVAGSAGAGKTSLCLQSLFNAAKKGESCVFISMLTESPAMVIRNMSQYSFFDSSVIESGNLRIFSMDAGIVDKGDFPIFEFINDKIQRYQPSRVVIDPITILDHIINTFEEKELQYTEKRGFIMNLFSKVEAWNTLLLLTGELSENEIASTPWGHMVDGIIVLGERPFGKSRQRCLDIIKMRGTDFFNGKHTFKIREDGITVFPRFVPMPVTSQIKSGCIGTGIQGLDEMLGGGLPQSTAAMVAGSAGCGKSVLGMQFIVNGILNKEPCLVISFKEELKEVVRSSNWFGSDLEIYETDGLLRYIYHPHGYVCPDELAVQIQDVVSEIGVQRVLIDSISGLSQVIPDPGELRTYIMSLTKYFKNQNITSIFTYELPDIIGHVRIPDSGLPFIMDSILILKNIEIEAEIKKSIMIMKMREREFDSRIKEFKISDRGIEILDPFKE